MYPTVHAFNLDPNYGAVSMVSDENKLSSSSLVSSTITIPTSTASMIHQQSLIKEERLKEIPSPNEQKSQVNY